MSPKLHIYELVPLLPKLAFVVIDLYPFFSRGGTVPCKVIIFPTIIASYPIPIGTGSGS